MKKSHLPVMRPSLPRPSDFARRLQSVSDSGVFSNYGPQVVELERRFAQRFNVTSGQVIVLSNATAALTGLVQILGPKSEWMVPAWTFTASVLAVMQAGGSPVLADVEPHSHRVQDDHWLKSQHALITLPFGTGIPEKWLSSSRFPRITDAAASMASVRDLTTLSEQSSIVFSLHATKYLGAGEGAVIVSGSEEIVRRLRAWSNFGFSGTRESASIGTNAKMSEFQAAIAHCVLDQESEIWERWSEIRENSITVSQALGIDIPELSKNSVAPYWIVDLGSKDRRDKAEKILAKEGIDSRRWWSEGCHRMPAFKAHVNLSGYPVTDDLASKTLGLPYFLGMSPGDFQRIHDALSRVNLES